MLSYSFAFGDVQVVVNRKDQVLRADVLESGDWMDEFRRSPLARDYVREWPMSEWMTTPVPEVAMGEKLPSPLHPSAAAAGLSRWFTPAFALAEKARAFDQRFGAKTRLLVHRGRGSLAGRRSIVERLRSRLESASAGKAVGLLDAALHLLGVGLPADGERRAAARGWIDSALVAASRDDDVAGETAELRRVAAFGRLLEGALPSDAAGSLREALLGDAELLESYRRQLAFAERAGGPLARPSVDAGEGGALFPSPSADWAPDLTLTVGARGSKAPRPEDPLPAHRLHALLAMLDPETEGIDIGERYRHELEDRFRALIGRTRESRPKGLDAGGPTSRTLGIRPLVTVEPLPGYYLRLADAYRAYRRILCEELGEGVLNELSERGTEITLLDEIAEAEALFRGAWVVAREELGRPPEGQADLAAVKAVFRRWQSVSPADPDLRRDLRSISPLEAGRVGETVRVRVAAGVETRLLQIEFLKPPQVRVFEAGGRRADRPGPALLPVVHRVLEPVIFDCDVTRIPSQRELRALCDASKGATGVREALGAR